MSKAGTDRVRKPFFVSYSRLDKPVSSLQGLTDLEAPLSRLLLRGDACDTGAVCKGRDLELAGSRPSDLAVARGGARGVWAAVCGSLGAPRWLCTAIRRGQHNLGLT